MVRLDAGVALSNAKGFLRAEFDGRMLLRAVLVTAPLLGLSAVTNDPVWLRAALVTISTFVGYARSGLAPFGVLLQGAAILASFAALLLAIQTPVLFVCGCAVLAAGAIALTGFGAKFRSLGNFTFIPALYLACEIGERLPHQELVAQCLHFLPFAALAVLPSFIISAIEYPRQLFRILRGNDFGPKQLWGEAAFAATLAVALAASLVEWRHLGNGQWVIWSAASVVTGNAETSPAKLRNRAAGAVIGVPVGIGLGSFLPHGPFMSDLLVLVAVLTLVAFNRYIVGFAARSMFVAAAFMVAGKTAGIAAERILNVVLGGIIGVIFVLAVHAIAGMRQSGMAHETERNTL